MSSAAENRQSGFTLLEAAVVVLIIGMIAAFATPKITNAMREYRLANAVRQITDMVHRAKTQATSENRRVTLRVDTAARQVGLVVYDNAGAEVRTDYVPLPQGVTFAMPANVTAPITGAPTARSVSFPLRTGSTTVFEQDFNSRGFPTVAAGTVNAVYLSNSRTFRAITINSVGGIGSWGWQTNQWVNTRTAPSSGH
jgi:prepilin-type N-terminal cleavage/methylation domain-containing protein